MKPSQFAKGFQARPDTTSSEKRTALDRLNAIDGLVQNAPNASDIAARSSQPVSASVVAEATHRKPCTSLPRTTHGASNMATVPDR